jgi:uncharacterized coiled-coil protein SlyX
MSTSHVEARLAALELRSTVLGARIEEVAISTENSFEELRKDIAEIKAKLGEHGERFDEIQRILADNAEILQGQGKILDRN